MNVWLSESIFMLYILKNLMSTENFGFGKIVNCLKEPSKNKSIKIFLTCVEDITKTLLWVA